MPDQAPIEAEVVPDRSNDEFFPATIVEGVEYYKSKKRPWILYQVFPDYDSCPVGAMYVNPHPNGGLMKKGGNYDNDGGPGQMRLSKRAHYKEIAELSALQLKNRLENQERASKMSVADLARALEVGGKFGLGELHEVSVDSVALIYLAQDVFIKTTPGDAIEFSQNLVKALQSE